MKLQGAWDKRKTKQDTEERSSQEEGHAIYVVIQNALSDRMEGEEWRKAAIQLGGCIKTLCGMLGAVDCDVDVENYPRVMYEAERETEPKPD